MRHCRAVHALLTLLTLLAGCTGEQQAASLEGVVQALGSGQIHGDGLPARTVVLTYDDGPDDHTLELARYLNESGVRATFFVNGSRFCRTFDADGACVAPQETRPCNDGRPQAPVPSPRYYPESLLDQLVALGHRIANHSQDHCYLTGETNVADLIWELQATQDILDRHSCDDVRLFRAPYGQWNRGVLDRLSSVMGFSDMVGPINWDVDGGDWECWQKQRSPEACADGYLSILNRRPRQNGIILMHDRPEFNVTYEGPLLMARILVPRLKAAGFTFATMDEVLKSTPLGGAGCPATPGADAGAGTRSQDGGGGSGGAALDSASAAATDTGVTASEGQVGGEVGTGGSTGNSGGPPRPDGDAAGPGVAGQPAEEMARAGGGCAMGGAAATEPRPGLGSLFGAVLVAERVRRRRRRRDTPTRG